MPSSFSKGRRRQSRYTLSKLFTEFRLRPEVEPSARPRLLRFAGGESIDREIPRLDDLAQLVEKYGTSAEDDYHPHLAYPLQPRPAPGRPSADRHRQGGQNCHQKCVRPQGA
ncbi:hypothetical protein E0H70_28090 [Rhizobium leguminosarum bv. viciae]|nr:hypothetical protein E0H70_28090 [Rhizobium leguminosarum bv. viciae]